MASIALSVTLLACVVSWAAEVQFDDYESGCETPDGQRLKPKFGDINCIFSTDVPTQRPQCLEAIDHFIDQREQNTSFASNTDSQ